MSHVIDHFMWGYQPHYRIHVEIQAKEVLKRLDPAIQPEVFLVGVLAEPRVGSHPACVEPENDWWLISDDFMHTLEVAATFDYPESRSIHSHPLAEARAKEGLFRRSVRDAFLQIVEQHPSRPSHLSFYVSFPQTVEGYLVSAVLGVQTAALERHAHLSGDHALLGSREITLSKSLLDAAIAELLTEAADGLLRPDPGLRIDRRHPDEVIREAGRRLAIDTAFRADQGTPEGMHVFFDTVCAISSLRYEKAEGAGKLLLAVVHHPDVHQRINFTPPVSLQNHRRARKLLELASGKCALHINAETVFALADGSDPKSTAEDIFSVRIVGLHHWQLMYGGGVLMGVMHGLPYLPRPPVYEEKLPQDLPRLFPGISAQSVSLIAALVSQAEQERRGTLLIVSEAAQAEATRLSSQATPVKPFKLTPEILTDLTGIDGAVLLDTEGCCYAIGVILDGLVSSDGDASRGARYNSAIRYVHSVNSRQIATLAVVVSEDGGVDLIPNLRPRVHRSAVSQLVEEVETMGASEVISRRRYRQVQDSLCELSFYLLPDDCERVNAAISFIEQRLQKEDPAAIHILPKKVLPCDVMDPKIYYESE